MHAVLLHASAHAANSALQYLKHVLLCISLPLPPPCSNQAAWEATARTQDLTPPVLQVVSRPPPDFDSAELAVTLDEPGVLFHVLLLGGSGSGNGSSADEATAACPPVLQQVRACERHPSTCLWCPRCLLLKPAACCFCCCHHGRARFWRRRCRRRKCRLPARR